jgi:acyl-coenzyme A thioesterase PaaI-like protein
MTAARMTAAELDAFLRTELPLMFDYDDLTIEHADGRTCQVRQRFRENMLRPGGTVSGATLMALADCAMYLVVLRKGVSGQDVLATAKLLKLGRRLAVGEVTLLSGRATDPIAHATVTYSIPNTW